MSTVLRNGPHTYSGLERQLSLKRLWRCAQAPGDASDQFTRTEELGEIVIRTDGQAEDLIEFLSACRQHEDIYAGELPDLAIEFEARQHRIKHGQVRLLFPGQFQASIAIGCRQHLILLTHQVALHQIDQCPLVINNQNACYAPLTPCPCMGGFLAPLPPALAAGHQIWDQARLH